MFHIIYFEISYITVKGSPEIITMTICTFCGING